MQKIPQREFQIKFYSYTKGSEAVQIVGRGGRVVGVFYPMSAVQEAEMPSAKLADDLEKAVQMRDVTPVGTLAKTLLPNAASEKFKGILGGLGKTVEADEYPAEVLNEAFSEESEVGDGEPLTVAPCIICRAPSTGVEQIEFVYDSGDERRFYICTRCAKSKGLKLLR